MKINKLIIISLTLFFSTLVHAELNLELTQGVTGATPIAIVPFSGQSSDLTAASPNNVAAVITNDLAHSGQFTPLPVSQMPQQPDNAAAVNLTTWQQVNMNDVVVGKVAALGNDRYRVTFQLLNVFATPNSKGNATSRLAWQNAVLLQKTFTVPGSQLRSLAHHISDLIYQQLTGVPGIFSTKIAYVLVNSQGGNRRVYSLVVSDADGYQPKSLLISHQPIMSPAWSPNGKTLAYVSFESGYPAIYIQTLATGQRQQVTHYPGINGAPAFSPDGKKLALVLTLTGYPKIYVLTLASHHLVRITNGWSIDTEPSWSPDGKSLLFTSNRGGGPQIYQINLATRQIQRLTFDGDYNTTASFTPDGQNIIVLHREEGLYNIALENLASGRLNLLTQSGNDQSPSVAPNGKMVVYAARNAGQEILGMVSTDSRIKLLLPSRDGMVREPAWSPFL